MGQAKRKLSVEAKPLHEFVGEITQALQRLAAAASEMYGGDCYMHAALGREILKTRGVEARIVIGEAAWRIGSGDGDVISHTRKTQGYKPVGFNAYPYHAWLEYDGQVIDLSTYQLPDKAAKLDAADGGKTKVEWAPPFILRHRSALRSYEEVAQGGVGLCWYERMEDIEAYILQRAKPVDAEDVAALSLLMRNPDIKVIGPNNLGPGPLERAYTAR